jgi:hypothetical protein
MSPGLFLPPVTRVCGVKIKNQAYAFLDRHLKQIMILLCYWKVSQHLSFHPSEL